MLKLVPAVISQFKCPSISYLLMSYGFKWLLFGSLCLVYSTMIIGVYLSSIHQSLSCSEWPLCPNGFLKAPEQNYIVEYMHRLFVGFTAGTIYATAVFARVKIKKLQRLTTLTAILVSIQIAIGALIVTSTLDIRLVTIHLPMGVALFGITLIMFLLFMRCPTSNEKQNLENLS
jgi:heme A synthase